MARRNGRSRGESKPTRSMYSITDVGKVLTLLSFIHYFFFKWLLPDRTPTRRSITADRHISILQSENEHVWVRTEMTSWGRGASPPRDQIPFLYFESKLKTTQTWPCSEDDFEVCLCHVLFFREEHKFRNKQKSNAMTQCPKWMLIHFILHNTSTV